MRILVVEDDPLVANALTAILSNQNYAVESAADGQAGLELVEAFDYDLLLLDVMLPKLDGISFCRQVRSQGYQMPILLLTGRDSKHDKAVGLDAGADDYVVKPFDEEELVARVRALLRRASVVSQPILEWGKLRLDPSSCDVAYGTELLALTPKEYALLELFLRNSHRVFSCSAILEHLWTYEDTPGEEAVRTHIKGLRQKLKSAGAPADLIETVYGIGYRLRPMATKAAPAKPSIKSTAAEVSEPARQQTLTALTGIWERFKPKVSEKIATLEQTATSLLHQTIGQELQQQAEQESHTLAGSLGTFGFAAGSRLAQNIESLLKLGRPLKPAEILQFQEWTAALRREIERSPAPQGALPPGYFSPPKDEYPLLLVVDRDRVLADKLMGEAAHWGLRVQVAFNLGMAREQLYHYHPKIVLLDPDFSADPEEGLTLLSEFNQRKPPVPVIVFTAQNSLAERIAIAQQGGSVFLQKPVSTAQVLELANQILQQADQQEAKVMIVDDDPQMLDSLRALLEPWGLHITTLQDARKFWETLEACSPDLLILDIEMPHVTGVELCQVVRNDGRWSGLPILFLTAHTEPSVVNQVFAVGADDFVCKPIVEPELVTRIINRLERIRLLRRMAEIDPLTLVSNRQKSTQDLNALLALSKRQNQPLCLAILDLDNFKQVNDRYGHATGDAALRQLGHLLLQSFRNEDVVARWGGEEFVIGLYGMNRAEGIQRLSLLLRRLRQETLTAPDKSSFHITGSIGIAQYPEDGADLQALYQAADTALYCAKRSGRDRVVAAEVTQLKRNAG
ncbi:MAG TPA: response regulator [Coleofasciculaceae cyanobacterium]